MSRLYPWMRTPQSSQLKAHLIIPIQPPKLCGFPIAKEFIQVYIIKKSRNMAMESVRTKGFFRGAKICCCFNCFAFCEPNVSSVLTEIN